MNTFDGASDLSELAKQLPVYRDYITGQQVLHMMDMQNQLNEATTGSYWYNLNQNWEFAIFSELNELMDAKGWKWWKNVASNLTDEQCKGKEQLFLEVVDIWHFVISMQLEYALQQENVIQGTAERLQQVLIMSYDLAKEESELDLDFEIGKTFKAVGVFDYVTQVARLTATLGFTLQDLYRYYILKNVLNKFRQDHGYKRGTYPKVWAGKEDNVYLAEILAQFPVGEVINTEAVYDKLRHAYVVWNN